MKKLNFTLITLMVCLFYSCNGRDELKNETFTTGEVKNDKYSNSYFDFTLTLPDDYYLIPEKNLKQLQKDFSKSVKEKNKNEAKYTARVQQIFGFRLYDPSRITTLMVNPTLLLTTERLDPRIDNITAREYLIIARKKFKQNSPGKARFEETATVRIGEEVFERQIYVQNMYGLQIKTAQYCKVINGYALIFSLSYDMKKDRQRLVKVLSSFQEI